MYFWAPTAKPRAEKYMKPRGVSANEKATGPAWVRKLPGSCSSRGESCVFGRRHPCNARPKIHDLGCARFGAFVDCDLLVIAGGTADFVDGTTVGSTAPPGTLWSVGVGLSAGAAGGRLAMDGRSGEIEAREQ